MMATLSDFELGGHGRRWIGRFVAAIAIAFAIYAAAPLVEAERTLREGMMSGPLPASTPGSRAARHFEDRPVAEAVGVLVGATAGAGVSMGLLFALLAIADPAERGFTRGRKSAASADP